MQWTAVVLLVLVSSEWAQGIDPNDAWRIELGGVPDPNTGETECMDIDANMCNGCISEYGAPLQIACDTSTTSVSLDCNWYVSEEDCEARENGVTVYYLNLFSNECYNFGCDVYVAEEAYFAAEVRVDDGVQLHTMYYSTGRGTVDLQMNRTSTKVYGSWLDGAAFIAEFYNGTASDLEVYSTNMAEGTIETSIGTCYYDTWCGDDIQFYGGLVSYSEVPRTPSDLSDYIYVYGFGNITVSASNDVTVQLQTGVQGTDFDSGAKGVLVEKRHVTTLEQVIMSNTTTGVYAYNDFSYDNSAVTLDYTLSINNSPPTFQTVRCVFVFATGLVQCNLAKGQ